MFGFTIFTSLLALVTKKITAIVVIRVSYNYLQSLNLCSKKLTWNLAVENIREACVLFELFLLCMLMRG
jgi:hypothetical protein